MKTISVSETLRRLEAHRNLAAKFDANHPGVDRRTAVESVLSALTAKQSALASSNEKKRQALRALALLEKAAAAMKGASGRQSVAPAASVTAAPPPPARPYAKEETRTLQLMISRNLATPAERTGILAELAARGITQLPKGGFSQSLKH